MAEGRWLNDRRYADDYLNFMYAGGGNDRHFTDYMADSVWGRYLVDGDREAALRHLPVMRHIYRLWDDKFDFDKGLYFVEPLLDATEYTVSSIDASSGKDGFRGGDAFRPSINSYMFANARALARLAEMAGDKAMAREYAARAEAIRSHVLTDLWSEKLTHFIDRHQSRKNPFVTYWNPIRNRELVGYLPWMFDLVPDDARYAQAWRHLLDPASLAGKAGMRTVEANYEHYMRQYRYLGPDPECQWNGPVWPYQTTQVLIGLANLLDHYRSPGPVTRSDYMRLLRQYTALHYQGEKLDLEEDYHPETGPPIVGLDRSHHYFHSGYNDLILTGLVGIRPRADDVLEVNPLLPDAGDPQALAWFRVQDVPYHGHRIAVTWDADGSHYGRGKGLLIEVDGREAARRATLGRLTTLVAHAPTPPSPAPSTAPSNWSAASFRKAPRPATRTRKMSTTRLTAASGSSPNCPMAGRPHPPRLSNGMRSTSASRSTSAAPNWPSSWTARALRCPAAIGCRRWSMASGRMSRRPRDRRSPMASRPCAGPPSAPARSAWS